MDWDDLKPKPKATMAVGDVLDTLSVAELEARITAFTAEIERLKAEIQRKKAQTSAAESLFKR